MRCGAGWTGSTALGLALDDEGFDFSVLSEFRARLVAAGLERVIFDLLLDRLKELGLVQAGRDGSGLIPRMCWARIRGPEPAGAGRGNGPGGAGGPGRRGAGLAGRGDRRVLAGGLRAADRRVAAAGQRGEAHGAGRPVRRGTATSCWRRSARRARRRGCGSCPPWRRCAGSGCSSTPRGRGRAGDTAGGRPSEHGLPPGRSRIISPYDTDARYSEKRGKGWRGYKVHLTETCHEPGRPGPGRRRT